MKPAAWMDAASDAAGAGPAQAARHAVHRRRRARLRPRRRDRRARPHRRPGLRPPLRRAQRRRRCARPGGAGLRRPDRRLRVAWPGADRGGRPGGRRPRGGRRRRHPLRHRRADRSVRAAHQERGPAHPRRRLGRRPPPQPVHAGRGLGASPRRNRGRRGHRPAGRLPRRRRRGRGRRHRHPALHSCRPRPLRHRGRRAPHHGHAVRSGDGGGGPRPARFRHGGHRRRGPLRPDRVGGPGPGGGRRQATAPVRSRPSSAGPHPRSRPTP